MWLKYFYWWCINKKALKITGIIFRKCGIVFLLEARLMSSAQCSEACMEWELEPRVCCNSYHGSTTAWEKHANPSTFWWWTQFRMDQHVNHHGHAVTVVDDFMDNDFWHVAAQGRSCGSGLLSQCLADESPEGSIGDRLGYSHRMYFWKWIRVSPALRPV